MPDPTHDLIVSKTAVIIPSNDGISHVINQNRTIDCDLFSRNVFTEPQITPMNNEVNTNNNTAVVIRYGRTSQTVQHFGTEN